jgi:hypothetical protein
MSEQWIQQMREKMAGYKWPAPEVSWEEIDQALAANKTRKARVFWLQRMAAAAILLLIAGVGYWGFLRNDTEQTTEKRVAENHQENHGDKENHGDWHNDSSAAKIRVPVPVILPAKISVPAILAETVPPLSESSPDTIHTSPSEDETLPRSNGESDIRPKEQTPPTPAPVIYPTDLHQRKQLDNRLTAKVYMSSTMAGSRQTESHLWTQTEHPKDTVQTTQTNQHVHHHQPVRFGLSLRYRLNDRWSVESGLSYTRLSSDITTTVDGMTTITEQHLNYIGLPLNISYDLLKSNHFELYITTGSTIEKSLDTSPWQFSLNGAIGAEYKLTDIFSLYAEPGFGYYFPDGSNTPTINQDRPLNLNLSFGLRFNLK